MRACVLEEPVSLRRETAPSPLSDPRPAAIAQIAQRTLFQQWWQQTRQGTPPRLDETGFRVFSQFEVDGILVAILAMLGTSAGTFVDVGAGDGIHSYCANLAINFGWHGLFIDGDQGAIERRRQFYSSHPHTNLYPPRFACAMVMPRHLSNLLHCGSHDL